MTDTRRSLNVLLTKDEERKAMADITAYFLDERSEEIGIIAATSILDFFLMDIAPKVYNRGIKESRTVVQEALEEIEYKKIELLA